MNFKSTIFTKHIKIGYPCFNCRLNFYVLNYILTFQFTMVPRFGLLSINPFKSVAFNTWTVPEVWGQCVGERELGNILEKYILEWQLKTIWKGTGIIREKKTMHAFRYGSLKCLIRYHIQKHTTVFIYDVHMRSS